MLKKGLGKGLGTLFDDTTEEFNPNEVLEVRLSQVEPNKNQPRKNFDPEKLELLAQSIKEHGLIQPITVVSNGNDSYTIVGGERRWRASKLAGLSTIQVIVKDYDEKKVAEISLIDNLQREDLNPIEEALGFKELSEVYGMTQDQISQIVGKSRSAVANSMRLLGLEEEFRQLVIDGKITEGHARALLSLEDVELRRFLANQIIESDLNVRQAEKLAKQLQKEKPEKKEKEEDAYSIQLKHIEQSLSAELGTKVVISNGAKKGKIEIEYYGNEDLERLLNLINHK